MALVTEKTGLHADSYSGKFGEPDGYGHAIFARSRYGLNMIQAGVYQKQMGAKGKVLSRHRDNWPSNPRTVPQQAWRALFRDAMMAWRALDTETKEEYNNRVYPPAQYGVNRFITEYIKLHR